MLKKQSEILGRAFSNGKTFFLNYLQNMKHSLMLGSSYSLTKTPNGTYFQLKGRRKS